MNEEITVLLMGFIWGVCFGMIIERFIRYRFGRDQEMVISNDLIAPSFDYDEDILAAADEDGYRDDMPEMPPIKQG